MVYFPYMGLFGGSKAKSFLGVDIGARGIKVVEIGSEKSRPTLLTYGYTEERIGEIVASPFDDVRSTGAVLADLCKQSGVKTTSAMAALPISSIFSAIVAVPRKKDEKEIKPLIDAQVAKLAPLPLAEMITYSTFIDPLRAPVAVKGAPPLPKGPDYVRVLVTGAAKSLVQKYIELFRVAKLNLQAIDTESFALIRALVGKDRGAIMIVDIGSTRSSITIAEKGIPFLSRSINAGGATLTRTLMEQTKVSEGEAEQMKLDLGNAGSVGTMPPMLASALAPIVHEMQFALQLYGRMELTEIKRVEKIILTGGSAHLPALPEYLASQLNINCYRGDPWARVATPPPLRPVLDEIGPRMSVAIGLAMRDIE